MSDVFISKAHSTAAQARAIAEALRSLGYSVWLDDELPAHRPYSSVIDEQLALAKAVVVVWSAEAVKSEWVQSEADAARAERKLVQLTIDGTMPPRPFDRIQCADMTKWSGDQTAAGWRKVLASVAELVGQTSSQPPPMAVKPTSRQLRPWHWALAAALLVLLVAGGVALNWARITSKSEQAPTPSMRVAIVPFDILGARSDATQTFADTLLDKIVEALAANQVDTVSRADSLTLRGGAQKASAALTALRVGMTLEGSVENDGKTITVRLHLDDVRQHQTLWSKEFRGPADSPEPLQTQVALHATDVTRWAVSPRLKDIRSDPSLVAEYLEGEDEQVNGLGGRALAIARDLVSKAPRFAAAHTLLASTVAQEGGLTIVTPEERIEAIREAKTAIALDSGDGQAYALLSAHLPGLSIKQREDLLLKGLSVEPGNASANWNYTVLILANTGRTADAIAQAQSAWQLAPFTEWVAWALPIVLANAGRIGEARSAIDDMKRKWPDNPDIFFKTTEVFVESQEPPLTRALALLDDPDLQNFYERAPFGKSGATDVLRAILRARVGSPEEKRSTAQRVEKALNDGVMYPLTGISSLASLGAVDSAFRAADRVLTNSHQQVGEQFGVWSTAYALFGMQTIEMRRDPRFMRLAQRLGLIDYWRSTGHWPDFCSEPGLPYDCKAVAATLK